MNSEQVTLETLRDWAIENSECDVLRVIECNCIDDLMEQEIDDALVVLERALDDAPVTRLTKEICWMIDRLTA